MLDLSEFFRTYDPSLTQLASYLRVSESYLHSVLRDGSPLTARDEVACRELAKRLTREQGRSRRLPGTEVAVAVAADSGPGQPSARSEAGGRRVPRRDGRST